MTLGLPSFYRPLMATYALFQPCLFPFDGYSCLGYSCLLRARASSALDGDSCCLLDMYIVTSFLLCLPSGSRDLARGSSIIIVLSSRDLARGFSVLGFDGDFCPLMATYVCAL